MRWPCASHTATLTCTLSCRAFAIAASTIEFASARVSVATCSVNASADNRKEPSASQVPRQQHKLAALLRAPQSRPVPTADHIRAEHQADDHPGARPTYTQ